MITPCPIENKKMNGASQRKYNQGTKAAYTIINIMSGNSSSESPPSKGQGLFTLHLYHRHYHLFHTHTAMLESIPIVIHVVVIIVGIT